MHSRRYFAHGTATDFMHDELHVALAMTWEVYGDAAAAFEDCFRMFNPLTQGAYEAIVEQWTATIFALVAALPGHPSLPGMKVEKAAEVRVGVETEERRNADAASSDAAGALGRKGGIGQQHINGDAEQQQQRVVQRHESSAGGGGAAAVSGGSGGGARLQTGNRAAGYAMVALALVILGAFVGQSRAGRAWSKLRFGRRRPTILSI